MPRHKYTTTDQRLAAARASSERERQRARLVSLCRLLEEKKPDSAPFLAAFWETRRLYLDMERQLEYLLWSEGVFKRPLLLDTSLTNKGGPSNGVDTREPITGEKTGDSVPVSDGGL